MRRLWSSEKTQVKINLIRGQVRWGTGVPQKNTTNSRDACSLLRLYLVIRDLNRDTGRVSESRRGAGDPAKTRQENGFDE